MRKLRVRDILATLVVAAVVVPFIGYSVRGSTPFVHDPGHGRRRHRGMPAHARRGGPRCAGHGRIRVVMVMLGVVTLGFGIAALIAETTWAPLVPMAAGLVIIWASALLRDVGYLAPAHAVRHA